MSASTLLPTHGATAATKFMRGGRVEIDGPFRLRVPLARVVILASGLILFMAWIVWDLNQLIASQLSEIKRLQEHIRHLDERLEILTRIRSHRPTLPYEEATALAHAVRLEAQRYELDWRLLLAIIRVESGFNPRTRSPRGAIGLMQVMPAALEDVAKDLGWADWDPEALENPYLNVRVGAHYLFTRMRRFGDLETALQAYYLGSSRIGKPSREWELLGRRYVEAVRLSHRSPGK